MSRQFLRRAAVVSAAMAGLLLLAVYWANRQNARGEGWPVGCSVAGDVRLGLSHSHLVLFNQEAPYFGSIIQVDGQPRILRQFHLLAPVYLRYFLFDDGPYWTLGMHVYLLLGLCGIFPGLWLRQWLRSRTGPSGSKEPSSDSPPPNGPHP